MPERRFRCLTIFIIAVGLAVAMAIPSIELVLGLVGSTMGVAVCVLLPAACYVKIVTKQNNERLLAQVQQFTIILINKAFHLFSIPKLDCPCNWCFNNDFWNLCKFVCHG